MYLKYLIGFSLLVLCDFEYRIFDSDIVVNRVTTLVNRSCFFFADTMLAYVDTTDLLSICSIMVGCCEFGT